MHFSPMSSEDQWSDHSTSPDRDEVEEIIRQTQSAIRAGSRQLPRIIRAPTKRVRIDESFAINLQAFKPNRFEVRAGSMDGSEGSNSSSITVITSAASSCDDPWSASVGFVEEEEDHEHGHNHEHHKDRSESWEGDHEQDQDVEMMLVPKLEPLEDELNLSEVKEVQPPRTPSAIRSPMQAKRPRGRPRKHPVQTPESLNKISKGRSKTGCITCRKRKKKCDEAKPRCTSYCSCLIVCIWAFLW
jgi:hypothetical protein